MRLIAVLLAAAFTVAHSHPVCAQSRSTVTPGPAVASQAMPDKAAVIATLEDYFTGADTRDAALLKAAIHPDGRVMGGIGGASTRSGAFAEAIARLPVGGAKPNPEPPTTVRTLTDLFVHGDIATAALTESDLPPSRSAGTRTYQLFQLCRSAGRWTIVSAAFHPDRYQGETDDRMLDVMGIRPGMTIGEVGAGDGRVTFALARRVGGKGKVYANDINPTPLDDLRALCAKTGITNIDTIVGTVDDPMFPKAALDLAIMAIVYHHLDRPVPLLKNLATSLKPGATLVILDPAYDRTGEQDSDRPTTRDRVEREAAEAGYDLVLSDTSLPRDNIFILRPKDGRQSRAPQTGTSASPARATMPPSGERTAILDTVNTWWTGHDTDDAELLNRVLGVDARTWYEYEGALQSMRYAQDIERIRSGNRRPPRVRNGQVRTISDFAQYGALAVVTNLVEDRITRSRSYTSFHLYRAGDQWQIINLAGYIEPGAGAK